MIRKKKKYIACDICGEPVLKKRKETKHHPTCYMRDYQHQQWLKEKERSIMLKNNPALVEEIRKKIMKEL